MKFLSQINVNTEYTLPIVDGTNGQVLATDGNGTAYWGSISAGATNLDALTDVILTSPSSGQLLRYGIPPGSGEAQPVWYNFTPNYLTPSSSIDNLGDVTITSAAAGQVLQWNGTAWVNATPSTAEYTSKVQHIVKCGVAVTKGQAVYVTSADGTNMIVGLASNATEATSSKTMGLAASTGAINAQIFIVTEGLLAGLDTSTASAGDPVWLGTGGNLIFGLLNKPVAPAHLVFIGIVTRVQQNNGEIFVKVQNGFELNELHDVLISSPSTGQLIRRDSDGLWKNWSPNFLTSYTETDPIFVESPAYDITSTNITNWNAAYNDKINSASFSTSTGVLTLTQQDSGTITVDLDGRYLESLPSHNHDDRYYTETEIAGFFGGELEIAGYNATNWDTAYGWGNHATAGYLTSFTEADTLATVTTRGNSTTNGISVGSLSVPSYIYLTNAGVNNAFISESWGVNLNGVATHPVQVRGASFSVGYTLGGGTTYGTSNLYVAGNVGVGTTTPTQKFEVSGGAIIASGFGNRAAGTGKALEIGMDGTSAVLQAYDRTASTYIPININSSAATFNSAVYASSIWATNYGPRDSNGNINFVDWSSNVIARINRLSGIASVGNRKLSMGILDINSQGVPEIRINTKIPFALGAADFTVNIKGFQYGGTNMVSLSIGWHYYLSQFYNETAISNGAFAPTITLGVDESNYVVIHLSNVGYWPKMYVESVYSSAYADDYVANWNWTDAGVDALSNTTTVPYKPLDTSITGNAAYATSAGNSATTSQTNFSTLTVSNNTVATQAWVTSQGYATSFSETDTLATVTARGASTNTFTSLLGGSKLVIQNANNGGSGRGIFMWSSDDSNWGIYMSTAAAGVSLAGGNAVASIDGRTSHHIRFRVYYASGNGFIWENNSEVALMSLTGDTGNLYTRGQIYAGNSTSNVVWHAGNDGSGSGLDADLLDGIDSSRFIYGQSGNRRGTNLISNWNQTDFPDVAFLSAEAGGTNAPTGDYIYGTQYSFHRDGAAYRTQLVTALYSDTSIYVRNSRDSDVWTSWKRLWHSGDFSSTNVSNWNTAYGWGNHAGLYLPLSGGTMTGDLTLKYSTSDSSDYNGLMFAPYSDAAGLNDYIIKAASDRGVFGRKSFGWHVHTNSAFGVYSNGWVKLFGVEGGTGNTQVFGNLTVSGSLTESSSIRYKKDILDIEPASAKLEQLRPVRYKKIKDESEEIGLIAEDVAELFPEVVKYDNEGRPDGVNYSRLSVILLKAVQELTERVNKLENK
jgi:hypothetical protein